jgi:predicted CXXCH cytochrome family protein
MIALRPHSSPGAGRRRSTGNRLALVTHGALAAVLLAWAPPAGAAESPSAAEPDAATTSGAAQKPNQCLACHRGLEGRLRAPTEHFAQDIHAVRGLGCVGCHGGDASDPEMTGMDPAKGFRNAPERAQIAEFCARCHADAAFMKRFNPRPYIFSMAEFRTSVHCKKISEGDVKVATCTNCHGVHGILPPSDPASPVYHRNVPKTCSGCHNAEYMKGRTVPTNQYALYVGSVHGRALLEKGDDSAPACNDCHGNHGAVPPKTRDITVVCGNCHGREGELFMSSPVKERMELEGKRGCVTCHGNHGVQVPSDSLVSAGSDGLCGQCHTADSPGARAVAVIVPGFHRLRTTMASADSTLSLAELRGMETSAGRQLLKQAGDQLVDVRVVLHSFDRKKIEDVLVEGTNLAEQAHARGVTALRDWEIRRFGMALSLIAIGITILLLVLKIRQIERA